MYNITGPPDLVIDWGIGPTVFCENAHSDLESWHNESLHALHTYTSLPSMMDVFSAWSFLVIGREKM
jgi:hypothetical protein